MKNNYITSDFIQIQKRMKLLYLYLVFNTFSSTKKVPSNHLLKINESKTK